MIYFVYLASLCKRRSWPEPQYEAVHTRDGYIGIARVNNREYVSETLSETREVAMEMAASQAYVICRNFSLNNGMYPDQRPNDAGLVQGLPVAIGTRRSQHPGKYRGDYSQSFDGRSVTSEGSSASDVRSASGSSSPTALGRCACGDASYPGYDYCARCYHHHHQLQMRQQQQQQQQQQRLVQQQLQHQRQQQQPQHRMRRQL